MASQNPYAPQQRHPGQSAAAGGAAAAAAPSRPGTGNDDEYSFNATNIDFASIPLDDVGPTMHTQQQQGQQGNHPFSASAAAPSAMATTATTTMTSAAATAAAAAVGTAYNPYGGSSGSIGGGSGGGTSAPGRNTCSSASMTALLTDGAVAGGVRPSIGSGSGSSSAPIDLSNNQQPHLQQGVDSGGSSGGASGSDNAQDEELRRQIEALKSQLSNKDEEIFNLQISLTTVEAESSHRTEQTEREAESRVRLVEDKLRLVQREADSARAGLVRERSKRKIGGVGVGGGGAGEQQPQQQGQHSNTAAATNEGSKPSDKAGGRGRVVTPPTGTEQAGMQTKIRAQIDQGGGASDDIMSMGASSGGAVLSRSQRLASHLLINLDILWPDDEVFPSAKPTAALIPAAGTDGKPQSKRRKKRDEHSNSSGRGDSSALTRTKMLTRSGAIHPGSEEAARSKQHQQPKQQEQKDTIVANSLAKGLVVSERTAYSNAEKASVRSLLAQIVSWDSVDGGTSSPPSTAVLVRDLVIKIAGNFEDTAGTSSAQEPMEIDGGKATNESSAARDEVVPAILPKASWTTVTRLFIVLRELLAFSAEARDVLRTWIGQTTDPSITTASLSNDPCSIMSPSKVLSRISTLGPMPNVSEDTVAESAVNAHEVLYAEPYSAAGRQPSSSGLDCWDAKSVEKTCGKFRDLICGAILGKYSFSINSSDANILDGILRLEKEACNDFLALMRDAPSPSSVADLGVWTVWFDELLPTAFDELPSPSRSATDLISVLDDCSTLASGFPSRRREKKKITVLPKRSGKGARTFVMEMKRRVMEILLCLIDCCNETRDRFLREKPLAKRALAAILDEVEGSIMPQLSGPSTEESGSDCPLRLCLEIISYMTLLVRSEDGFELLRTQMVADYRDGGGRELASSGAAVMVDVLHRVVLEFAAQNGNSHRPNAFLWQSILDKSMTFFHLVLLQVTRSRLVSSDNHAITLLSTVGERREMFIGVCRRLQEPGTSLRRTLDPEMMCIAFQLHKEIGFDLDEEAY